MENTVTIAIPVYNGQKYIQEALDSIISQTYRIEEVLISDNKSTDNTINIVNEFISNNPNVNVRLHINEKNLGPLGNHNKCIELCDTDFLHFLHSDDKLKPNGIQKQIDFFNKYPEFAIVAGKVDFIDGKGNLVRKTKIDLDEIFQKGEILEFVTKTSLWIQPTTVMLNMKFKDELGYIDSEYIGGDERYWASVLLKFPIAILGDSIIDQRVHLQQSGRAEHMRFNDKIKHFEMNLKVADFEQNPTRRHKTKKLLKKWIAIQSIIVSRSVKNNYRNRQLSIKYWIYGLKTDPFHYFNRYFFSKLKKLIKRF